MYHKKADSQIDRTAIDRAAIDRTATARSVRQKRLTRRLLWAILLLAIACAATAALGFFFFFLKPAATTRQITVPAVTGMEETAARTRLGTGEYRVTAEYRYSEAPKGTVLSQTPAAGSTRKISVTGNGTPDGNRPCEITLVVSLGAETVRVPDTQGLPLREAKEILESLGLQVKTLATEPTSAHSHLTAELPETAVADYVSAGTLPPAGTELELGTHLILRAEPIPLSTRACVVPSLTGLERQEAEGMLLVAGFSVGAVRTVVSEQPRGTVIAQDCVAGNRMVSGSAVGFTLSDGSLCREDYFFDSPFLRYFRGLFDRSGSDESPSDR